MQENCHGKVIEIAWLTKGCRIIALYGFGAIILRPFEGLGGDSTEAMHFTLQSFS